MIEITKLILSFFTTWVFSLFVLLIMFRQNFDVRHEKMIVCMTLACSFLGFYISTNIYNIFYLILRSYFNIRPRIFFYKHYNFNNIYII